MCGTLRGLASATIFQLLGTAAIFVDAHRQVTQDAIVDAHTAFELGEAGPDRVAQMLDALRELFSAGILRPPPITCWPITRAPEAFRRLAQASLVGKAVLTVPAPLDPAGTVLVTGAGGLAMLVGIIILGTRSGTYLLSELVANPPSGTAVSVGVVLMLVGAVSKSALVPLHFWLPGAMAAPTPVSAYLHAAAMVKAGVYLVARLAPGFADAPPWRPIVVILGCGTLLLAGWRSVREYDLKLILAFGTVSQLGMITVMVGAGSGNMMLAGLALLVAHAMFKASLFMVVGIVDHATGTRDIRRLAGLGRRCPWLLVISAAAAA